eukprot:s2091_g5.t1
MLRYVTFICFTKFVNVKGERPNYADTWLVQLAMAISELHRYEASYIMFWQSECPFAAEALSPDEDLPAFRGASSFSKSTALHGQTLRGPSFLTRDVELCHDEKENVEEVFEKLGFRNLQGSYCQWRQVVCEGCHVKELRVDLQHQEQPDVPVRLSPALGRLQHLELLDLGGSSKLSGDLGVLRNATELHTVNLSHSQVEGNLDVFQHHPKLKVLDLEGTKVEGSLQVFQTTPLLQVLNMVGTIGKISGDTEVFKHTKDLKILTLNATEVEGDIDVFRYTSGLQELSLINALHVTGRLLDFFGNQGPFKNLEKFVLINSSYVRGHVVDFIAAKKLEEMHIENAKYIDGDLSLLSIPSLRKLILKGITMEVDFTELDHQFTHNKEDPQFSLSELHLELKVKKKRGPKLLGMFGLQSRLTGDIGFLRHFPHLQVLNLRKSNISGDIGALRGTKMRCLNLFESHVSGSIGTLQLDQMELLNLGATEVAGDIAVFQKAAKLQDLDLSRTQVFGDVSSFSNSPNLRRFHIYETGLSGDIQGLQGAKELQELLAWRTKLEGDIEVLSQVSASLKRISMGKTFVHGDLKSLSNATKLKSLACTHCNVSGDIATLAQDTQLAQIWLSGTSTFGDISALGNMKLEKVFLDRTNISGNVEIFLASRETVELISLGNTDVDGSMRVFHRAPKLQDLNLAGTRISGDLEILSDVTTLRHLRLDRCNVTGNIAAISTESLEVLSLSETRIFGNLRVLSGQAKLRELKLAATAVQGDLSDLTALPEIEHVDLSRTNVTGSMNAEWDGHCKKLQYLDLSEAWLVYALQPSSFRMAFPLPTWKPQDGWVISKEIPAAVLPDEHVAQTVMNQGLEILPALTSLKVRGVRLNGTLMSLFQLLSSSKLSSLVASGCRLSGDLIDLSSIRTLNRSSLRFIQDSQLAKSLLHLDISNNSIEFVEALPPNAHIRIAFNKVKLRFAKGVLTQAFDDAFELDLRSTPLATFSEARELFYAGKLKQTRFFGQTYEAKGYGCFSLDPGSTNVQIVSGLVAITAPPHDGFARLEAGARRSYKCFQPSNERCNRSGGAEETCAPGYAGYLCMDCRPQYFASGGRCWRCDTSSDASNWRLWAAAGVGTGAMLAMAGAWIFYPLVAAGARRFSSMPFVVELKQKAPLLLQSSQLWAVLSALSISEQGRQRGEHMRSFTNFEVKMPELPYIRGLRFSLIDLQGTFNFQCVVEGATARYWVALLAPIVPLLFLLACGVLESSNHGISKALLVLSIFFVGGASSCAKLISCKLYDAGGDSLGQFAFQELMPSSKCSDLAPEVWGVFLVTSLCYAILVPCFLSYLFAKQHFVLRSNKLLVSCSKPKMLEEKELHFEQIPRKADSQLSEMKERNAWKADEEMLERRLVAAAVAYSAVFLDGEVQVALKDSTVMLGCFQSQCKSSTGVALRTVEGRDARRTSDIFYLHTLESFWVDVVEAKEHGSALRCHAITEMLMERCVLFEHHAKWLFSQAMESSSTNPWWNLTCNCMGSKLTHSFGHVGTPGDDSDDADQNSSPVIALMVSTFLEAESRARRWRPARTWTKMSNLPLSQPAKQRWPRTFSDRAKPP